MDNKKALFEMKERRLLAISIKHTEWKWKFGKPCVLWGWHQTKDDEKRCFADYTQYPNKAEVYSLQDWLDSGYGDIIKMDEPVHMTIDLCKKYKNYDTVLIDKEEYIGYCKMACLPLDHPTEKVCTGKRCPMQVGYDVKNCKDKDCIYRTETEKGGAEK